MYIQNETTPNPNAIKFLPGFDISPDNPIYFKNMEEASNSVLARKLLTINEVDAVFFGSNFITITKIEKALWSIVKPEIIMTILDHFTSGLPIFDDTQKDRKVTIDTEHLPEIEKQIVEIIETKVRPAVAMDGGDINYVSFVDGVVTLQLKGACSGCPSSSITLKNGIESMLKHYVPEVSEVVAENAKQPYL